MTATLSKIACSAALLLVGGCSPTNGASVATDDGPSLPAALPALEVAASSTPTAQTPRSSSPNSIVLITLDTLRRDHLGCYGYFRETSPNLDAFAAQGLVFERALSTAASTFPSHLSMLTGLYPHQHGRTSNQEAVHQPFASGPGCSSLARALRESGWRTAGFVSSRVLAEDTGINDGFETFWCPGRRGNPARAATTADRALSWLAGLEPDAPFFLWIHLWDTHEPNDPPEPYASMFSADERVKAWIAGRGIDPAALREKFTADPSIAKHFFGDPRAEKAKTIADRYEERRARKKGRRASQEPGIDESDLVDLWNRYDGCVRYLDDQLGRILEGLKQGGLWENAIVAVVADHGQSLGENVSLGHGRITNVNTFVPFLLRVPGGSVPARRDARLVSLVDLTPTVLGRFAPDLLAEFRKQLEGSDVLEESFARPFVLVEEASEFHGSAPREVRCALLEGRWKYLFSSQGNELYDLEGGGEGVDVLAQNWDEAVRLHAKVEELLKRRPEIATGTPVSAEKVQELLDDLEDMGYVEGE